MGYNIPNKKSIVELVIDLGTEHGIAWTDGFKCCTKGS